MKNDEIGKTVNNDFLQSVSDVLAQAQKNVKTAVNLSMVYAYYEIGGTAWQQSRRIRKISFESPF